MRRDNGLTLDLPGVPKRRGRPCSANAMSNAERQRKFRKSHKAVETGETMSNTIKRLAEQFDLSQSAVMRELLRFALCNRNWSQTGFSVMRNKKSGRGAD